jgi:hypothetical protein
MSRIANCFLSAPIRYLNEAVGQLIGQGYVINPEAERLMHLN